MTPEDEKVVEAALTHQCTYPPCGQPIGFPCRTKAGRPLREPHKARWEAGLLMLAEREEHRQKTRRITLDRTTPDQIDHCLGAQSNARTTPLPPWDGVPRGVPIFMSGGDLGPAQAPETADAYSAVVIDSALNVRTHITITIPSDAHTACRTWCEGQTDVLFARYVIDGIEHIGWPTRTGIDWKEAVTL